MQNSWMEAPLRYSCSSIANCWISCEDSFVRSCGDTALMAPRAWEGALGGLGMALEGPGTRWESWDGLWGSPGL